MEISEIVRKILEGRGVAPADFERFLNPDLGDLLPPTDLPGVAEATEAILATVIARRKIVVFGDYDCDGICATAIVVQTLSALGAVVEPFLPDRLKEGYGMSAASVARLLREHPDVGMIVTVDNGINSVALVAELKAKGISVIVTDHHLPGSELPAADALVNPKVAAPEALGNLCGAGVAFLLAKRLISEARARGVYDGPNVGGPLLVLAGLATVTDIMPLVGQNRIIVSEALRHFASWAPPGLRELHLRAMRTASERMTSRDFSFALGPRINAAGRMASGLEALELILETDREIVRELARIVDGHNSERKQIEQHMTEEALAKVVWTDAAKTVSAPAQVIELPDGHPGVAGIVAARIQEQLEQYGGQQIPVCVLAGGHGSARAPEGINIRDAFVACDDLLTTYGGHAAAGGFAVKEGMIDAFRERLCAYCAAHAAPADVSEELPVEVWVEPKDLTLELAEELQKLEPYGEGNGEPVFGMHNVYFTDVKPLGAEGKHLSVRLSTASAKGFMVSHGLRAVWWGHGDRAEALRAESARPHDLAFTLTISDYGERHVELRLAAVGK